MNHIYFFVAKFVADLLLFIVPFFMVFYLGSVDVLWLIIFIPCIALATFIVNRLINNLTYKYSDINDIHSYEQELLDGQYEPYIFDKSAFSVYQAKHAYMEKYIEQEQVQHATVSSFFHLQGEEAQCCDRICAVISFCAKDLKHEYKEDLRDMVVDRYIDDIRQQDYNLEILGASYYGTQRGGNYAYGVNDNYKSDIDFIIHSVIACDIFNELMSAIIDDINKRNFDDNTKSRFLNVYDYYLNLMDKKRIEIRDRQDDIRQAIIHHS